MPLPFLPPGQSDLPAERFILFVDVANVVQRIDESQVQKDGVSFTSEWQSPTLNRIDEGKKFTLTMLELFYASLATTISVSASGDGGTTFTTPEVITLPLTGAEEISSVVSTPEVTGKDIRFKLEFDTDVLVNIYGYRPHLVDRGDLEF